MSGPLSTVYLGLDLAHPLVASAGPLTADLDSLRRLEDAGCAAVVLPSLFQEEIEHEELEFHRLHSQATESFPEALDFFPEPSYRELGTAPYLELIRRARESLGIPVIASLNGCSTGGWERLATEIAEAGAHALELNAYFVPVAPEVSGAEVEAQYRELVRSVCGRVRIPVAVKLAPWFSSLPNVARELVRAGAKGLVLFNRLLHPEIDLDDLSVQPRLELSSPREARLSSHWIAILRGQVDASLAHSGGIHHADGVVRALLAGADAVMATSSLVKNGASHVGDMIAGLRRWMEEREYASVAQMTGSMSRMNSPDPSAFERANYTRALVTYTKDALS